VPGIIYNNGIFIVSYTGNYLLIFEYNGSLSLLNVDLAIYDGIPKEGLNWLILYAAAVLDP
jgi:hypothetical protein